MFRSREKRADKKDNSAISRREFLRRMVVLGGWLFADHSLRIRRIEALTGTIPSEGFHPGFIEQDIESSFFTIEEGHGGWLREAMHNPVARKVCRFVINEMDTNAFPSVGHAFASVYQASANTLMDMYPTAPSNLLCFETRHVALIASAIVFSNFIDYAELGFDTRKWGGSDDLSVQRWGETGIARKGFPPLFPTQYSQAKEEVEGKDRTMHFFNHALLAYMLPYSAENGGTAHLTTPPIMNLVSDYLTSIAPEQAVHIFTWLAGVGYEVTTTEFEDFSRRRNGKGIEHGALDREIAYDFAANRLGAEVGFLIFQGNLARAAEIMYDPRLVQETSNPQSVLASVLEVREI